MLPAAIHRRWAEEFVARAQNAQSRKRAVNYMRLAVSNCVRALYLEAKEEHPSHQKAADKGGDDGKQRG